jgi:hypothetical protein
MAENKNTPEPMAFLTTKAPTAAMSEEQSLYDADILLWSEQQAELLRRRAANELDWDNLVEEIEAVGRNELHAVMSHLRLALLHDLKAEAWPLSRDAPHWRAEARGHRGDARQHFTPSMAQRLDVEKLYREARRRMPETTDGALPLPVPATCPVTLEELLAEDTE